MKTNWWQRWKHWLLAKGRHGTHSPFVYGFVEEVLRNKSKKQFEIPVTERAGFSVNEAIRLLLAADYLKPRHIFCEERLVALLNHSGFPAVGLPQIDELPEGALIVPDKLFNEAILEQLPQQLTFFIFHPYYPAGKELLEKIKKGKNFPFVLDCYDFILLIRDPAFKQAQTFLLK